MASSVPALAALLKRTDIDDHEEVLRAAENALKQSKGDLEAQHIKVVALLKLDRYEDAVKAVEAGGADLKETANLEYAYALYKSGRPADAVKLAKSGSQRGARHVEAQASYRTEDFETAAKLYRQFAAQPEHDEIADLRINSGAVDAQLEWTHRGELVRKKKPEREDMEAFETAYNAACGSIARGELGQGEVLLKRARDLCNSLEDLTEDDKKAELLPITVQQIYVLIRLGRQEEAEALSKTIDTSSVPDASTSFIAQVNETAANASPSNPFLAQRLLQKNIESLSPDQPFNFQTSTLRQNRYALDLQALKHEGTANSISKIISQQNSPNLEPFYNSLSVVNAAARAKGATGKEGLKQILPLLEQRPNDIGLILTVVQFYVLTGNSGSAIVLLESLFTRLEQSGSATDLDVRYAPGLVGAVVSLYSSQSQRTRAQRELAKAGSHWRRKSKDGPAGVTHLLKAAGTSLLQSQDHEHRKLASDIFSDICEQNQSDHYASAGLIAADPTSASAQQVSSLTPIDRLIADVDITKLENAGVAQPASFAAAATARKRPAGEDAKPRKAKKIRKSRLPKDYDPNRPPDPERWLPLRDRSSYKPKGKKGKARANLLSQGTAPAGDSDASRPGTPGAEVVKGKQQGGGGGGKNKKGKNKR